MSENRNSFDMTDPLGIWRSFRDANMDAWAKAMANLVNTEAFAQYLGVYLDTYLATSAPFQKAVERYMERYLASLSMPARGDVTSLAQRMTNMEMRLDDLDAKIDQILLTLRAQPPVIVEMLEEQVKIAPTNGTVREEQLEAHLQSLGAKTEELLNLLQRLQGSADTATQVAAPARNRKPKPPTPVDESPDSAEDIAQDKGVAGFQDATS